MRRLRAFVVGLWIAAFALLVLAARLPSSGTRSSAPYEALLLIALFACAEIFVVHVKLRRDAHTFSFAEIALVVALFAVDPIVAVVAAGVGSASTLFVYRGQRGIKLWFNAAKTTIEVELALVLFHVLVTDPDVVALRRVPRGGRRGRGRVARRGRVGHDGDRPLGREVDDRGPARHPRTGSRRNVRRRLTRPAERRHRPGRPVGADPPRRAGGRIVLVLLRVRSRTSPDGEPAVPLQVDPAAARVVGARRRAGRALDRDPIDVACACRRTDLPAGQRRGRPAHPHRRG